MIDRHHWNLKREKCIISDRRRAFVATLILNEYKLPHQIYKKISLWQACCKLLNLSSIYQGFSQSQSNCIYQICHIKLETVCNRLFYSWTYCSELSKNNQRRGHFNSISLPIYSIHRYTGKNIPALSKYVYQKL